MSIHEGDMRPWLACAATLASTGDIAGLAKSDIFAFDADDNNSVS